MNPIKNRGYRSPCVERPVGKWKGVHTKQQYNGAQAVYSLDAYANGEKFCVCETVCALFAAVSNALTVFGCFRRQCIVATSRIPLDRMRNQTAWTKTDCTASRLDVGVISRCLVRLADVEFAKNGITVVSGYVSWARPSLSSTS